MTARSMLRAPNRLKIAKDLERWVVLPFAATGGLLGAVVIWRLLSNSARYDHPLDGLPLAAIGVITAGLTWCALKLALRASCPKRVARRTVITCLGFAVLNSSACFLVVAALHGSETNMFGLALVGALVGLPLALPLGALWALAFIGPMYLVADLRQEPTLDGPDRVARAVGGTLTVIGGFGALSSLFFGFVPHVLFAVAAAGAIAFVIATVRLCVFHRFLRRVRLGIVDGWAIVPLGDVDEVPRDLPSTDLSYHPDAVLVRSIAAGGEGAYRIGALRRIPWARTRL